MQPGRRQPLNDLGFQFGWKLGAVISACVAMLAVQMFRADQHRWIPAIWIETTIFTIIPVALFWLIRKWRKISPERFGQTRIALLAQGTICFSAVMLIFWQFVSRANGLGDANEVVALSTVQLISWHLAVFGAVRGFERASFMLCGALVFFVCCMTNRQDIFVLSAIFAVSSLWWMAGLYWSRLDSRAIDGEAKMLAIHGSATVIAILVMAIGIGLALLIPISRGQISVAGFMPFSGGEEGYQDEFASSGIGDGNMLMAGTNAETTGAVDSDEFIEDDKPSIYDVMSDMYDGPAFKKRFNRAVAIDKKAKHIHDVKQSEQSGLTFRTMRDTERTTDLSLEDKISNALFYVEGSVPARFAQDTFQRFDGWDWSKSFAGEDGRSLKSKIKLNKSFGKPFYQLLQSQPDYLTTNRLHKVKMMRLESRVLPTPSFLNKWHIAYVDQKGIFNWGESGLVEFAGEAIPTQVVIDIKSFVPNYHVMRSQNDLRYMGGKTARTDRRKNKRTEFPTPDSQLLEVPSTSAREKIDMLAKKFTAGIAPGWNQVESITNHLRSEFELTEWQTDESVEDTVGHFMERGGGPSHMFATSCAMILRSAGYPTRLTRGFLVRKEDYDRSSKQSVVSRKSVHMWPEVCLDGKFWIPVEPTPGYPIPYSTETTWQRLVAAAQGIVGWFWQRPLSSILLVTLSVLGYRYRAVVITSLMLGWWHLVRLAWPQGLLSTTQQLIDLRFWAAGDRRPRSKTIRNWYSRVEPKLAGGFFDLWNAKNYSSSPPRISTTELLGLCREQVESITFGKILEFVSDKKQMENR